MSRRLYIGRLAPDATRRDIETFFDKYGTMTDVRIMNGFGFVEFENVKDAEDAIAEKNGEQLLGENLILEPAKEARRRDMYDGPPRGGFGDRGGFDDRFRGPPPSASRVPPRAGRGRVIVKGISSGMSWQDLKDFGREGGPVSFADVDRDNEGQGIIEYPSLADAEDAIKKLDGQSVRGSVVTVVLAAAEEGAAGGGDYRRDERDYSYAARRDDGRGYDRRDDRRDYDRRGDDRDYYSSSRRDDRRGDDYRRDERRYDDSDYYSSSSSSYYRRGDDRRDDRRGDDRRDDRDRYDDRRGGAPDRRDDRRREPEPAARRERSPAPVERRRSRSPAVGGEKPTGWE
ncbi:hypothetical protein BDY24DRAFT_383668 [Mrakia frigida]|uniref:RNA-binding protein n=1 Tax=Mrakia frigida TaxID=29902 RepID=UPI003FCC258B